MSTLCADHAPPPGRVCRSGLPVPGGKTARLAAGLLALLLLLVLPPAAAQPPPRYLLSIPPADASQALGALARQTTTPLLYLIDDLGQGRAHGVQGYYTLREALDLMLAETGIAAHINENGVITVSIARGRPEQAGEAVAAAADAPLEDTVDASPPADDRSAQARRGRRPRLEEVVVTGTRLRQVSGMAAAVPVTALRPDVLDTFQPSSTIAEQLDVLPQFFATQTAQRGGGALFGSAGGSYLNMRGMGPARTLVLFDGSRVVPADRGSSVNVDTLPVALLRNVEVVTGGASAAYGADALAGVVNFVLDREFEGFKLSGGSGITQRGDGHNWNFSMAGGSQVGDRLNVIASLEARRIHQIMRGPDDLENFQRWGYVTNPQWRPDEPPGTHPQRLTMPWVHSTVHTPTGLINQPGFKYHRQTFTEDGMATRPFIAAEAASFGGPGSIGSQSGGPQAELADRAFNGGPYGAEVVSRSAFLGGKYDLRDDRHLFGQVMWGHTESNQNHRRGNPHLQSDTWHATIYHENPFLPEDIRQAMGEGGLASIRVDKLGQVRGEDNFNDDKNDRNSHNFLSATVGGEMVLANGWDLRAAYQYGRARKTTAVYNLLRLDRLFMAIDAVRDPDTGALMCNVQRAAPSEEELRAATAGTLVPAQAGLIELPAPVGLDNSIRDCVPLNIFGLGNVSPQAAAYVVDDKVGEGEVRQHFAEAIMNGELMQTRHGPLAMALGATWRDEAFWQHSLPVRLDGPPRNAPALGIRGIPPGFLGGSTSLFQFAGVPAISGGFDVWEVFGELNLPLWSAAGRDSRLDGNLAWRLSDYSLGGRVDSWKLGLDYRLTSSLRLRATRSRDVREATFSERFDTQGVGGNVDDPAFGGANVEITTVSGGNPALSPERADTTTIGLVLQPDGGWLQGLQFSADWYEIRLSEAIGQLGAQRIVDECQRGVRSLCQQLSRNAEGILVSVNNLYMNIDAARVRGVDVEAIYNAEPDLFPGAFEALSLRAMAGYLYENSTTPLGGSSQDLAGALNWPALTATLLASYNMGPFGLRLQQRYIDSTTRNPYWREGVDVDDNTVASQSVTNMGLYYTSATADGSTWQLALDVNNLWDREPPVVPFFSQRSGAQLVNNDYDVFGRRFHLSLNLEF